MTEQRPGLVYTQGIHQTIYILAVLAFILFSGSSVASQDFFDAAKSGDTSKLKQELSAGTDVDARDEDGYTALMWAARRGQLSAVQLLKESGAKLDLRTPSGSSAYKLAATFGRYHVADYLRQEARDARRQLKRDRRNKRNYSYQVRLSSCDKKINILKLIKRSLFDQGWNEIVQLNKTTVSAYFDRKKGRRYQAQAEYDPENYTVTLKYTEKPFGKRAWLAKAGKRIRRNFSESCY